MTQWIVWPDDAAALDRQAVGGKAAALAKLLRCGWDVPPFFVVTGAAMEPCRAAISGPLAEQIRSGVERIGRDGCDLAVRSSAIEEDSAAHSFAGLFDSFLSVPPGEVVDRVLAVGQSGFSDRVSRYRRAGGHAIGCGCPAVIVQRMVRADASGVAFAADPVTGRRGVAVVSARRGLGDALVSGQANADTFWIDRDARIVDLKLAAGALPALADDQVVAIARLARSASGHFGRPQDVEWAIEDGRLYVLQSRPITSLAQLPDPDGSPCLWDNANISESYSGVTTPLTFSFARTAYEGVYRQFALLMSVPRRTVETNANVFRNMLGFIQGRVYYNLLNWYRVLAMLPGFAANRRFMEQMMGVREPLPESVVAGIEADSWAGRLVDRCRLAAAIVRLAAREVSLPRRITRFCRHVDLALGQREGPLADLRLDELGGEYRRLETRLLSRWDAPLVNDFFTMIFFGVLRGLTRRWCGDASGALAGDLVGGEGNVVSAEPASRIREMAHLVQGNARLIESLCEGSCDEGLDGINANPQLQRAFAAYLDRFGERCLEELKLESPTLVDDPLPLLRAIGHMARRLALGEAVDTHAADRIRRDAEAHVSEALDGQPLRRLAFLWILRRARRHVRDRENLRFERTQVFGRVRRIFVEIGRRLFAEGRLDDPRNVFYLDLDEVLGFVEGTITCPDLRGLAAVRRAEFQRYRTLPPPASRCETRGAVHVGSDFASTRTAARAHEDCRGEATVLRGTGCSRGVVCGRVRIVRDPRNVMLGKADILVAEQTDPGWVLLFPSAAGVLVQRGSLLSHSAVLAREMGIPTIVAIDELLSRLRDGDCVEMDGTTGVVRIVHTVAGASSLRSELSRCASSTSTEAEGHRYNLVRSAR